MKFFKKNKTQEIEPTDFYQENNSSIDNNLSNNKKKEKSNPNPYLLARREWNERYGDYITQAQNWKKIAFISISMAVISVAGVIFFASQNHIIPYIVEVDKLGRTVQVYENTKMLKPNQNIIKAQLAQIISDIRSVTADNTVTKNNINRLYAHLHGGNQAFEYIGNYLKNNSPFKRALEETVNVEIKQVLPLSNKTWQIEWIEKSYSTDGRLSGEKFYTATTTISVGNEVNQKIILLNPIGLIVKDMSWSINFK